MKEADMGFFNSLRNICAPFLHNDRRFSLSETKKWFKKSTNKYFIVEYDSEKAGYIRTSEWDFTNKSVYVGVDIDPKFRKRGIASDALGLFIDNILKSKKINKVSLEVLDFNKPAISLYKKLGFKEEGRIENYVNRNGKPRDSIIMCKKLTNS